MNRRLAARHLLGALAAIPLGCAAAGPASRVADGVHVLAGQAGDPSPDNRGRVGNVGFIVGTQGVLVVDTGPSYREGQMLLQAVRSATDRPVRLALVTHTRPEFLFGGGAMQAAGVPVAMHERCAMLMAARCEHCLERLQLEVGAEAMRGTAMYRPDRRFTASHAVEGLGREVRVMYFGHSSGPGDIAVYDVPSGTLFAGGLLDHRRIPDIEDARLDGWRAALRAIRALGPERIVPGHGPVGPAAEVIDGVERYLAQLEARTRELVKAGASLLTVPDDTELPEFKDWDGYETVHRRNASVAFLRIEQEVLFK